jgi:hypothetical protein
MVLNHLIVVNILVILLDVSILALEFANLFDIQTAWKPLVYSVKLKLEFSILNRLVELTRGRHDSSYGRSHGATHTDDVGLETLSRDRGSMEGGGSGSPGEIQHVPRGSASSASSEVQFAKYGN